jgi:hypothetical protein
VALALFTLALSGAALAQGFEHQVRANIPFNFYANGKLQHAGSYTFAINLDTQNIAMVSREKNTGWFLRGLPEDGSKKGVALLTFRTNGQDVYVLQKVQWPDFGLSFDIKKVLTDLGAVRPINGTETVLAQLGK